MASFNSINGKWKPAKEKAVNRNNGDIYEGPDREAIRMEKKAGGPLGRDALTNPDMIMAARQLGMTVQEYVAMNVTPTPEAEEYERTKKDVIVDNNKSRELPKQDPVDPVGGGQDTAGGGQGVKGGFKNTTGAAPGMPVQSKSAETL